jgi:hypothetical protein
MVITWFVLQGWLAHNGVGVEIQTNIEVQGVSQVSLVLRYHALEVVDLYHQWLLSQHLSQLPL